MAVVETLPVYFFSVTLCLCGIPCQEMIMSWFRRQIDELKLLLFMMVGVSPPRDLQERMGLLKSDEQKAEEGKEPRQKREAE